MGLAHEQRMQNASAVQNASGLLPNLGHGLTLSRLWGEVSASPQPPGLTSGPPCSAGGTGVLLNVDRVAEQLEELGYPAIQVRGLADSGWFLDNKQYRHTDCVDTITCAPTEAIRRGIRCSSGEGPFLRCSSAPKGPGWSGICGRGAPGGRGPQQPNLCLWLQVLERGGPGALPTPVPGGRGVELLLWL